ncbi:MAG TPA: hypothetical protein VEC36_00320 [Patescibacteria group bacterium]|nr:hypothetical protein [Patescibacteria group bacterium]
MKSPHILSEAEYQRLVEELHTITDKRYSVVKPHGSWVFTQEEANRIAEISAILQKCKIVSDKVS